MINVIAARSDSRCDHITYFLQEVVVTSGNATARLCPCMQMGQFRIQDGCLQPIHVAVDSFHDVIALSTVPGEALHPISQSIVIRYSASGITIGA